MPGPDEGACYLRLRHRRQSDRFWPPSATRRV